MSALKTWVRAMEYTTQARALTLPGLLDSLATQHGERPALIDPTDTVTYANLAARANRYARWAISQHLDGKTIGLLLANCADYVAIWLGLTRAGCTVALLNTEIKAEGLVHCLAAGEVSHLITTAERGRSLDRTACALAGLWEWPALRSEIAKEDPAPLTERALPDPAATALLIYTSGTTGLPKAARITHRRITEWSFWFAGMMDASVQDRLYNCLPLYHSTGGIVAVGAMLVVGGAVVIRERFSARQFWLDVARSRCTIFQYIGELCRYLCAASAVTPLDPMPPPHHLRLAVGNGLQQDIWPVFQSRFAIPQILEFYAATEGGLSLYNVEGKVGAIGRIPPMLERQLAIRLIRVDPETGVAQRDGQGLCIACERDEPGEAISRLREDRVFDGYTNRAASERKIIRDVLAPGDQWFRSGDLLKRDGAGYFYFVDRLGDTFRYKGQNVSTTEVAQVLRGFPAIREAVVYGVAVPGQDGRAGMAAITVSESFDITALAAYLDQHLPGYAVPQFIRRCTDLDLTGTFKLSKTRLATEGLSVTGDPLWHRQGDQYQRMAHAQAA